MKELTIEEKAKAYDEAKERMKDFLKEWKDCGAVGEAMEKARNIFPELKESEGERIRKALLEMVYDTTGDSLWVDYNIHKEDAISWLEKQGKQKPADKVEPKFKVGDKIIRKEFGSDFIHNPHIIIQVDILDKKYRLEGGLVAHFSEQDDYELVEQKPVKWSEEDDARINQLLGWIDTLKNYIHYDALVSLDLRRERMYKVSDLENWLKSLRPQPKQEWSEKDIEMIDWLIRCCKKEHKDLCNDKYGHQDIVSDLKRDCREKWDWLESLKNKVAPQKQ